MKKVLLVIGMLMFAVSAYAADLSLRGDFEMTGFSIQNANGGLNTKDQDWNGVHYLARIWGDIAVDPSVVAHFRYDFADQEWGGDLVDKTNRVWITYKPTDSITINMGRPTGANYARSFGNGFWNKTGEGTGGKDLIRADFAVNSTATIYTVWEKRSENTNASDKELYGADAKNDPDNIKAGDLDKSGDDGEEADLYVLGANIKSGNLGIYPVLTYYRDLSNGNYIANQDDVDTNGVDPIYYEDHLPNKAYLGLYLATEYLPKTGLNAKFAVAYLMDNTEENTDAETGIKDYIAVDDLGAYLDLAYAGDSVKIGAIFAYASANEEKYTDKSGKVQKKSSRFAFGGEFEKTTILDKGLRDGDGIAGATAAMLYTNVKATDKLTISAIGAYYVATDDKIGVTWKYKTDGSVKGTVEALDFTAYEADLSAVYAATQYTKVSAGAAYAQIGEFDTGKKDAAGKKVFDDAEPIIELWWKVATNF